MDYRYLKAFILTAQHSSFSKAAKSLNIAQSAVSRQIKLLEESLGEELIIRSSKKVLLTEKGHKLFVAAQNFEKMSNGIFERDDGRPLRIGILHGLLENWCSPLLVKYYKKYSRNIYIHVDTPERLKRGITEGKFDLLFTTENIQSELISSLKLFDEKLVLISRKDIDIKNLHQYRWIVYNEGDNLFTISKQRSNDMIVVDSITTIVNLVRNGVGIAVVPDHLLKKSDGLKNYKIPRPKKSEIYMSTLNYKVLPKMIKEFVDIVKKEIQ